jgi:FKBP-type peptidyl-prolyl cis-trans isomerase
MNKITILAIMAFAFTACSSEKGSSSEDLTSEIDSISYAYGELMAVQMRKADWPHLNPEMIKRAFTDFNDKGDSNMLFAVMEADQILRTFDGKRQSKINGEAGKEYLDKNKENEGVTTLPSGLQYKVIASGDGETPNANDTVLCHYTGHFISGKVFDSTQGGEPAKFTVDGVIDGWTEALLMMKTGDKWMLYIPAAMAYGEGGGQTIPPNSSLVFEIELVEIVR